MAKKKVRGDVRQAIQDRFHIDVVIPFQDRNQEYEPQDVRVVVNDEVIAYIRDYLPPILELRGIKATDDIDDRDGEVREHIIKGKTPEAAIELVRNKYRGAEKQTVTQVVAWAMLRDSIFSINGDALNFSIEGVEIPEIYWENNGGQKPSKDGLVSLKKRFLPQAAEIVLDKTNVFEIMLGLVTEMMNADTHFASQLSRPIGNAYALLSLPGLGGAADVDLIGFLADTVGELFSPKVVEIRPTRNGPKSARRIQSTAQAVEGAGDGGDQAGITGDGEFSGDSE